MTSIIAYRPYEADCRKKLRARFERALAPNLPRAGFLTQFRIRLRIEAAIDRLLRWKYPPTAMYFRTAPA